MQDSKSAAPTTSSAPSAECEAHEAAMRGERRSLDLSAKNAGRAELRVDMRDLLPLGLIPSRGEAGEGKPKWIYLRGESADARPYDG